MSQDNKLTTQGFWNEYWNIRLEKKSKRKIGILGREIHRVFDTYLPNDPSLHILEIGGAPGEYLLYLAQKFGYHAHSMDYSEIGNMKTKELFNNQGIEVTIHEQDIFVSQENPLQFDIVYSLGFIEHFDNIENVIDRHLAFLKPGGILLLGVPNLSGIYHWFLKYLSPSHDKSHNLSVMDIDNWETFEKRCQLKIIYKGYIGGFEPLIMKKLHVVNSLNKFLYFIVKILMVIFSLRMTFLRRINSKYWSGYLVGVYSK
jgi:2-polyprenyl-3-methyl-5-hydroxy-6-metoxy-1,4-benzoquinol methylase